MKKKYMYQIWMLSGIIGLLTACSNDHYDADRQVPLSVSSVGMTVGGMQSRAATELTSGSMGVFCLADNGYTATDNVEYTYSGGWSSIRPIYLDSRKATLVAYYPYGSVSFAGTVCTLAAQKYDESKDIYYDVLRDEVNNASPVANFVMERVYACLKLKITRMATYDAAKACNVTNVNLKSAPLFYPTRTLDLSTGLWGGAAVVGGWTYALNTGAIAAGTTNESFNVLLPAQDVTNGLTLTLTVDGTNRSVTVPGTKFENELKSGHEYIVSLQIRDTELTVPAVSNSEGTFGGGTNPSTPSEGDA